MSQIKLLGTEKLIPDDTDLLAIQETSGTTRRITRGNFLAGLSGDNGNNGNWQLINDDYNAQNGDKIINANSTDITVSLPLITVGEIEFFNVSATSKIFIDLQNKKYNRGNYQPNNIVIQGINKYVKLIYFNDDVGWYPLINQLDSFGMYPPNMALWLEGGSFNDKSNNNRHASPVGSNSPVIATGIDGKQVFRWNGTSNQELQVNPFLSGTNGATAYVVFTVSSNTNYNLLKTANIDDYWRFTSNGSGYFGTFQSSRIEAYPAGMPSSGHHLVSIHASLNTYEVILDNVARGVQSRAYSSGDRFRIASNDKPFSGDIALILIYPEFIDKSSFTHISCVQAIKSFYPSLPFSV